LTTKSLKRLQGNGFAVYKLVAYFETAEEMNQYLKKPFKMKNDNQKKLYISKYEIFWGTQYDRLPKTKRGKGN
jgi:hypothetical protein